MKTRVLLIEDSEAFVNSVRLMLRNHPVEVVPAFTGTEGIQTYKKNPHSFASVIVDYILPDIKGSEVSKVVRKINPEQDILFASGYQESNYLMDLLETGGARSFIFKGRPSSEIRSKILESISSYQNQNRVLGYDQYTPSDVEKELRDIQMIGRSGAMAQILEQIKRYRESPFPVLIIGETGTGKELIARALVPKGKKMIVVPCPAFIQSENLLESELFGYVKGAFTGANQDRAGLLVQAHGEVLFLDELHELSLTAQAKLLRFLQEMRFRRVGDHSGREISIQFKLISATKPEIFERLKTGRFLEDLYHRVAQLEMNIPALRVRTEDIEPLVRHIQDEFNIGKPACAQKQIRISTIQEMVKFPWNGNVRQLQNAVRRMFTDARGDIVNPPDFENYLKNMDGKTPSLPRDLSLSEATKMLEVQRITSALAISKTLTETAAKLKITRWTLNRKLVRFGINHESHLLNA